MTEARPGRIILLNGTSSSGKTTLVRALQAILPDPWLEIGIDRFVFALPKAYLDQPLWSEVFRYVRPDGLVDGPFRIETGTARPAARERHAPDGCRPRRRGP